MNEQFTDRVRRLRELQRSAAKAHTDGDAVRMRQLERQVDADLAAFAKEAAEPVKPAADLFSTPAAEPEPEAVDKSDPRM